MPEGDPKESITSTQRDTTGSWFQKIVAVFDENQRTPSTTAAAPPAQTPQTPASSVENKPVVPEIVKARQDIDALRNICRNIYDCITATATTEFKTYRANAQLTEAQKSAMSDWEHLVHALPRALDPNKIATGVDDCADLRCMLETSCDASLKDVEKIPRKLDNGGVYYEYYHPTLLPKHHSLRDRYEDFYGCLPLMPAKGCADLCILATNIGKFIANAQRAYMLEEQLKLKG